MRPDIPPKRSAGPTGGGPSLKRVTSFTLVMLVSFFVVALGVRNQFLHAGKGPKQHPRAVIEQADGSLEKGFLKQTVDLEHQSTSPRQLSQQLSVLTPPLSSPIVQRLVIVRLSARAPPRV